MSGFLNNLFGTIAGPNFSQFNTGMSFIPVNAGGQTIDIKGDNCTWLGLKSKLQQKYAYDYCYPLASVVDRLAEYDITGIIEILRSKGKGKENYLYSEWGNRMRALFENPNPMQSWEQFRGQQSVYKRVFGYCPVLPFVPAGMPPEYATSMINLPPWLFEGESTKQIIYTKSTGEIVKEWTVKILGKDFKFTSDQIIILEDSFMQDEDCDFLLPQSRLVGLDMAVSNICRAMEANNVLLTKRGPLGFISGNGGKDGMGSTLPMQDKEKKDLQSQLTKYGLSLAQYQYVISGAPATWNPMSFNVTELGIDPTIISGSKAICHRYGFPYTLFEQQDSTYANGLQAEKGVYQNNVIPNSTKDLNKYNKFFKAAENNGKIVANFEDVAALKEDKLAGAQAAKAQNDSLKLEYDNNLITKNMWLKARGYDTIPDGDKYKTHVLWSISRYR